MKPISRKQHAFVDYVVGALEVALPAMLPAGTGASRLLRLSGGNAMLLGALTRHELGLVKVLPMRAHLALDGVFAATFLAAAAFLGDEEPSVRATLGALGATGAAVALLTDPDG